MAIRSLNAGTTYSYRVTSTDAAGNVAASENQSFTTEAAGFIATSVVGQWDFSSSIWSYLRDNKLGQLFSFYYPAESSLKAAAFRFYEKRPVDSSFSLAVEFTGFDSTSCTSNGTKKFVGGWSLLGQPTVSGNSSCYANRQSWRIERDPVNAASYSVGEYSYYITVVDPAGKEGAPSPVVNLKFLQPITILAPTAAQSPTSPIPTFKWQVGSDWPIGAQPHISIFDSPTASNRFWVGSNPIGTTENSKVYDGPALDPTKKYRVSIYKLEYKEPKYAAMPSAVTDFWIGTTTSRIRNRQEMFATIFRTLEDIRQKLNNLLR